MVIHFIHEVNNGERAGWFGRSVMAGLPQGFGLRHAERDGYKAILVRCARMFSYLVWAGNFITNAWKRVQSLVRLQPRPDARIIVAWKECRRRR